jgi:carboxyl-terminal processing protease
MSKRNFAEFKRTLSTALVVAATGSVLLLGCTSDSSVARVFGSVGQGVGSPDSRGPDYQKFRKVFIEATNDDGTREQQLRHFNDAFLRVRRDYVHDVSQPELLTAAITGIQEAKGDQKAIAPSAATEGALDTMLASLDPHSIYLNPEEYSESQVVTSGQFGGLGIEINAENGVIKVIAPIADTPAEKAGIKSGDLITQVDGQDIRGMKLTEAVRLLRGAPGTGVVLRLTREGVPDFDVKVTRAIIQIEPVKWAVDGNYGYINVTQFISRAEETMERAMRRIRAELGPNLKGVVLDLRNNPGGLLTQSVEIADAFLNDGKIVSVRDRQGETRRFDASPGDIARGLPMVVLINRGSASASEIVAGALQDHHRAMVLGVRSFGKGSVQVITPLDWGGALRLTTSLYYLPSGRTIQGRGVLPDIGVTGPDEADAKREADLPHALAAGEVAEDGRPRATLDESQCPVAGTKKDDRLLGCALMYLQSGSPEKFLASMAVRPKS